MDRLSPWYRVLELRSVERRKRALAAIRVIGDARAARAVSRLTYSPEPDLRRAAAETLGELGGLVAVTHLLRHLQDPDPGVRRTVADALERTGWQPRTPGEQ
ncbi:MAG: HEAT repeat domain-containing protein, partial [Armatimonadetes bacterium]|nr:HEAT repeat domain-containing protein [Armatimonadota bacterium]